MTGELTAYSSRGNTKLQWSDSTTCTLLRPCTYMSWKTDHYLGRRLLSSGNPCRFWVLFWMQSYHQTIHVARCDFTDQNMAQIQNIWKQKRRWIMNYIWLCSYASEYYLLLRKGKYTQSTGSLSQLDLRDDQGTKVAYNNLHWTFKVLYSCDKTASWRIKRRTCIFPSGK